MNDWNEIEASPEYTINEHQYRDAIAINKQLLAAHPRIRDRMIAIIIDGECGNCGDPIFYCYCKGETND